MTGVAGAAITGLGFSELGKVYGRSARDFGVDAIRDAIEDAGLAHPDVDGLLINAGITRGIDLSLGAAAGLGTLRLMNQMNSWGSTAGAMIQFASLAVANGLANHVVCVFADAPLAKGERSGTAYGGMRWRPKGMPSLQAAYGMSGPIPWYAMAAQRHMDLFGTTRDQLGTIATSTRAWAQRNPRATLRDPLSLQDYHASPWIVEPFHVLDCCLVTNGAVAVIVSSAESARDLAQPPVHVRGMGQAHVTDPNDVARDAAIHTPAAESARTAFEMAGATPADVTQCQLYDCYTYTVLVTLEDYGFCKKGEGGPFVESGALGPDGSLPTNTGGGQLSAYYMWGLTPVSEAVIQARGHGGERQVANDLVAVSGNGGMFSHHATLLLSPHAS